MLLRVRQSITYCPVYGQLIDVVVDESRATYRVSMLEPPFKEWRYYWHKEACDHGLGL